MFNIDSITLTQPTELFFDLEYYMIHVEELVNLNLLSGGVPHYVIWSNGSTDLVVYNLFEGDISLKFQTKIYV